MVFGGSILGGMWKIWGNPYLNSRTILFDMGESILYGLYNNYTNLIWKFMHFSSNQHLFGDRKLLIGVDDGKAFALNKKLNCYSTQGFWWMHSS